MSPSSQTTIIPHSQEPLVTYQYPSVAELGSIVSRSAKAQKSWKSVSIQDRIKIGHKFMEEFKNMENEIPLELTKQMGRPISQTPGEIRGTLERANYMLSIAEQALAPVDLKDTDKPGFKRYIKREPLGVVFVIAPWNFPFLTSINSVLPAIIAGNSVILKPSPQTPLTAHRLQTAFEKAGLPADVFLVTHLSPELTAQIVQDPRVNFVSFTGSVANGKAVAENAVKSGFKGVALELGGKDPAYVRSDANIDYTVAELVDGAFFNSGQSCCAIERIYVHESIYDKFVTAYTELVKKYKLGDPTEPSTNLGPVVSVASAERIRKQVEDAVKSGAKALIPEDLFPVAKPGTPYVAPQVLVNVDHHMDVMKEETFGPAVGIMPVPSDDAALELMNDSPYGLTASIWTSDQPDSEAAFQRFVDELETGTVFLNRCDYLDPALAWTGVKDSGRGISLSKFVQCRLPRWRFEAEPRNQLLGVRQLLSTSSSLLVVPTSTTSSPDSATTTPSLTTSEGPSLSTSLQISSTEQPASTSLSAPPTSTTAQTTPFSTESVPLLFTQTSTTSSRATFSATTPPPTILSDVNVPFGRSKYRQLIIALACFSAGLLIALIALAIVAFRARADVDLLRDQLSRHEETIDLSLRKVDSSPSSRSGGYGRISINDPDELKGSRSRRPMSEGRINLPQARSAAGGLAKDASARPRDRHVSFGSDNRPSALPLLSRPPPQERRNSMPLRAETRPPVPSKSAQASSPPSPPRKQAAPRSITSPRSQVSGPRPNPETRRMSFNDPGSGSSNQIRQLPTTPTISSTTSHDSSYYDPHIGRTSNSGGYFPSN
ncbi:Aldehyde dehydrogenase [Ceratobasidium theobromae]|uniref:Aldehyde dehydrogenase n=1 Tax=Ceratobasidium theobromae TaxID=1582974 RepID=A0A5N5QH53_9AGAM|nr:Aldehyde dehydrogenase [Ceratobasidium theobromae]